MIPIPLAGLGLLASILPSVILPLQLASWALGLSFWTTWLPMLVFELTVAFWLLIRGVGRPAHVVPATGA
jgi:hypothetical protein